MTSRDELSERRRVAEEAARAGGEVHLRYFGKDLVRDVHGTNRADYTTAADLEAQDAVKAAIARHYPAELVVGEEDIDLRGRIGGVLREGCWLTDPLDGTQEFAHGNPGYSCVVGFVRDGEPLAGAVYFPAWDEMFSAAKGLGATLNGAPIRTSGVTELSRALLAVPQTNVSTAERRERFIAATAKALALVEGLRMPGARSLMVCGVAAGRYDITSSFAPRRELTPEQPFSGAPWETAAFVVLVAEAGGAVAALDGGPPDLLGHNTFAATRELLEEYQRMMGKLG